MIQEIKIGKFNGILVKYPDGADKISISNNSMHSNLSYRLPGAKAMPFGWTHIKLPEGKWEIIGNPFKLTDELLPIFPNTFEKRIFSHWIDILNGHRIYQINPYGSKSSLLNKGEFEKIKDWIERSKNWQAAEERTGNWILIQKLS